MGNVGIHRRGILKLLGAGAAVALAPKAAEASVARALSVADLVTKSSSVVVATALARSSSWQTFAGARRIVTDTRVRIDELVTGADPKSSELLVRTLGGRVGNIGQVVDGEAELDLKEPALLFVREVEPALFAVTAMAQGHYPIALDAQRKVLRTSRRLPALLGGHDSATERLSGKPLDEALRIVRTARP